MDDDPMKIAKAIRISRKCIGIVYQNIVFALVVKFACLALGRAGYREYVGRDFRRRWRDGAGRAQRDSRASGA